jgi:hypothetical protein
MPDEIVPGEAMVDASKFGKSVFGKSVFGIVPARFGTLFTFPSAGFDGETTALWGNVKMPPKKA